METCVETPTKQRIQFDFTPDALKRLENLMIHVNASSKAEVIRNALKLYEWIAQADPDDMVELKDKEGKTLSLVPVKVLLP